MLGGKITLPARGPVKIEAIPFDGTSTANRHGKTQMLRIDATIDGVDELHLQRAGATWKHLGWAMPMNIQLNGVAMDPSKPLQNARATRFIDPKVDLRSAVMIKKSARGAVDLYLDEDGALVVSFNDPQPGADAYHVEIEFDSR